MVEKVMRGLRLRQRFGGDADEFFLLSDALSHSHCTVPKINGGDTCSEGRWRDVADDSNRRLDRVRPTANKCANLFDRSHSREEVARPSSG